MIKNLTQYDATLSDYVDQYFNKEDLYIGIKFSLTETIYDVSHELMNLVYSKKLSEDLFSTSNLSFSEETPTSLILVRIELQKLLMILNKENSKIVLDMIYSFDPVTKQQIFNYLSIFYNDQNILSKLTYMMFFRDMVRDN